MSKSTFNLLLKLCVKLSWRLYKKKVMYVCQNWKRLSVSKLWIKIWLFEISVEGKFLRFD